VLVLSGHPYPARVDLQQSQLLTENMSRKNRAKEKTKQASEAPVTDNVATLPLSPGQRLKQAREKLGLSRAEVAERLFLNAGFVAHLEDDEFDQLPGPTFVKGYIKSYSRILNLSPEPLIALYKEQRPDQEFVEYRDKIPPADGKITRMTMSSAEGMPDFTESPRSHSKVSYAPHLVGILIVSAGIAWVATEGDLQNARMALNRVIPVQQQFDQNEAGSISPTAVPVQEPVPGGSESVANTDAVGVQGSEDVATLSGLSNSEPSGGPVVSLVNDLLPGMAVNYQLELPFADEAHDTGHRLKLTFLEKARVVVRDGAGIEAHDQVHARGAEVRVALLGRPPYQVSVDSAAAVTMSFDGIALVLPNPNP
jgi:cytoskeleton protein RodZ